MFSLKHLFLVALTASFLQINAQDMDIVDTAVEAGSFNTLVAAVQAAGLEDTLRSEGPFTVFAPTDDAFAALPEGTVEALLNDIPTLQNILLYHVAAGALSSSEVVAVDSLEMANGDSATITVTEGMVKINDATIVVTDVQASNGVIHVIDAVILPPEAPGNIIETARAAGNFNTLLAALDAAGLTDALAANDSLTVFAPTDDAFAALPEGTVEALLSDIPTLQNILLYHVFPQALSSSEVAAVDSLVMSTGETAEITVMDGMVKINQANIIVTDVQASNGFIHVIDAVILPPEDEVTGNIVEIAEAAGNFSTLLTAVEAAGLTETLSSDGPFTVFAPTDAAFAALPEGALDALLADTEMLAEVLLYHVVPGRLTAADIFSEPNLRTAQGSFVPLMTAPEGLYIGDALIVASDIEADNGIIHVIDAVLLPPERSGQAYEVTITNVTKGQIFSPPFVMVHNQEISLFTPGAPASNALTALAEEGSYGELVHDYFYLDQAYDLAGAAGPLMPGESVTVTVYGRPGFNHISVAGMLVSTNDSFFAGTFERPFGRIDWLAKDNKNQQVNVVQGYAQAWDAGTEGNSETCATIPGPPCNGAGVRNLAGAEGFVHMANGVHGTADLDAPTYDWNGPVAVVKIRLQ